MAQRKSKDDDGSSAMLLLFLLVAGMLVFIPFLLVSIFHYYALRVRYGITADSQRIFQTSSIFKPISFGVFVCSALVLVLYFVFYFGSGAAASTVAVSAPTLALMFTVAAVVALFLIWVAYHVACWVAATYYGVLVDRGSGKVILQKDMDNYSITDYLKLKFIYELGKMEAVNLKDIKRLTREHRSSLFIHGPFGSRGLDFPSKQKRDECMSAIEEAMGKRKTMMEFE